MAVFLSPIGGAGWQFFDNSGVILSGGKLYTYEAGTTTPQASYTSSSGNTPHTNPIILNSAGRVPGGEIWLNAPPYKFALYTAPPEVLIATYDNISGVGATQYQVQRFTGTGSQTAFTLSSASLGSNFTFVYINGVYQQKNTYTVLGAVLTFSQAPPVTSSIEVMFT